MCFVVIVLGKAVYFFSPLPLSKSRLAVLGAPIPLLRAHAVARTQFACKKFVLDQYGDHVLRSTLGPSPAMITS